MPPHALWSEDAWLKVAMIASRTTGIIQHLAIKNLYDIQQTGFLPIAGQ